MFKSPAKRDYMSDPNGLMYASRRRFRLKAESRQRRDEQYFLNRIDELLNSHKNGCEIPPARDNVAIEHEMHF